MTSSSVVVLPRHQMDFVAKIPIELCQEIFSFVQSEDDLACILPLRTVSRTWKALLTKMAWKLAINMQSSFTRKRLLWLTVFPNLHTLIADCGLPNNQHVVIPLEGCLKTICLADEYLLRAYCPVLTSLTSVTVSRRVREGPPPVLELPFLKGIFSFFIFLIKSCRL